MRKLAISLALASTALASPALARDDQWYVGVDGGAMIVEDLSLKIAGKDNAASVDTKRLLILAALLGMISAIFVLNQKSHIAMLMYQASIARQHKSPVEAAQRSRLAALTKWVVTQLR